MTGGTSAPPAPPADAGPRWLPWVCLGLLALPFHPLWVDFEQVRRGLLLVFAGALLVFAPRLPRARGGGLLLLFVGALALSALVQVAAQSAFHDDDTPWSFQPWEAAYRVGHWLALLVIVRAGAWTGSAALVGPIATLLLITSAYGVLQRLGVAELAGYGVEREPVSTLGNLNVASEWTAVAAAAAAALLPHAAPRRRWLVLAALACAGAYLVANPSRSGKVALAAGLVVLALVRRGRAAWIPLLTTAAGAALGAALVATVALPQLEGPAMQQELERGTVTLQVRFEIASGAVALLGESPVFGKGPGQFQVEYPRHRSQDEIDASSFGRQFPTEVRNAHDDWLELLVDGGLPLVLLFGAALFALQRGQPEKGRTLPLFVLLLLMFIRAPVLNAPAAALAFWLAGAPRDADAPPAPRRARFTRAWTALLGLLLLVLGALPVLGNTAFVPYLRAKRDGRSAPVAAAASASWWMPYEPRWFEVRAREAMNAGDLQQAAHLAARALALRPFSPPLLLLLAEVLARGSRYGEAIQVALRGLKLDPANPELRQLVSAGYAELGDVERAIRQVVEAPHPALRAALDQHFLDLAGRASDRGEPRQANRYLIEHLFVAIADRSGSGGDASAAVVGELQKRMVRELKRFERDGDDLRWLFTGALAALDLGRAELAAGYADAARQKRAALTDWQRALLGAQLERLREEPAWRGLLGG